MSKQTCAPSRCTVQTTRSFSLSLSLSICSFPMCSLCVSLCTLCSLSLWSLSLPLCVLFLSLCSLCLFSVLSLSVLSLSLYIFSLALSVWSLHTLSLSSLSTHTHILTWNTLMVSSFKYSTAHFFKVTFCKNKKIKIKKQEGKAGGRNASGPSVEFDCHAMKNQLRFYLSVLSTVISPLYHNLLSVATPAGTKPRTSHHRSPGGERHRKRKRLAIFLERTVISQTNAGTV